MKKLKLRGFVLPTLYLLISLSIFAGIMLLAYDNELINKQYNYGTNILDEVVVPVIAEDDEGNVEIKSPISEGSAEIGIYYYNKDDQEDRQQKSLIFYENTYLPNTGILYISNDTFEVMSLFAGKVTDIINDEFFGKCVVIEHDNNLKSYYYGLEDIKVAIGNEINTNDLIGMSKNNEIMNNKKSFLLEVYHKNELINPQKVINTTITDYD